MPERISHVPQCTVPSLHNKTGGRSFLYLLWFLRFKRYKIDPKAYYYLLSDTLYQPVSYSSPFVKNKSKLYWWNCWKYRFYVEKHFFPATLNLGAGVSMDHSYALIRVIWGRVTLCASSLESLTQFNYCVLHVIT